MVEVDLLDLICRANDIELSLHSCQNLYMISDRLERESHPLTEDRKSISYKIELLWSVNGGIFNEHNTLRRIAKHLSYVQRKNELKIQTISYVFDHQKSIIQILCNTIEFMLQVQHLLYAKKNITTAMHEAYAIVNKAETHGYYLLSLSADKNVHQISDILLYLKYVNRLIKFVGHTLLEPFDRDVEYNIQTGRLQNVPLLTYRYCLLMNF